METYLVHHGILGQKWGVRRYQNYDGTLIKSGSSIRKKTRYTNIDGSLNESGKLHAQKYINKEIAKNDKYYNKYIKKYNKLADRNSDDKELNKKFKDMAKDAERSRKSVNENIKNMGIDEIMSNEKDSRDKVLRVAGAIGGTAAAIGTGAAVPALAVVGASKASDFLTKIDPATSVSKIEQWVNTPQGKQAEKYVDTAIRAYSDVNAYAFSIYADQTLKRMQQAGLVDQAGKMAGQFLSQTKNSAASSVINATSNTVNNTTDVYAELAKNPELVKLLMTQI